MKFEDPGGRMAQALSPDSAYRKTELIYSVFMALKAVFDMNSVKHVPSLAVSSFLELQRVTVP